MTHHGVMVRGEGEIGAGEGGEGHHARIEG